MCEWWRARSLSRLRAPTTPLHEMVIELNVSLSLQAHPNGTAASMRGGPITATWQVLALKVKAVPNSCAALADGQCCWYPMGSMPKPLTADEILPLVKQLTLSERARLIQLIGASCESDARAYRAAPVTLNEFSSDEDPLAWDADGWENVG